MNKQTGSGQIPEELAQIPEEYFGAASEQGTVERLEYQTWESMSYEAQTTQLTKTAYVYLPYGYSGEQQYNVLYLMHGGWSNEETYLGTPENPQPSCFCRIFHGFGHCVACVSVLHGLFSVFSAIQRQSDF